MYKRQVEKTAPEGFVLNEEAQTVTFESVSYTHLRLCRNREVREHNNCISYSHISEGWCELVDKRQNVLEKLIIEEAIGEFMDLLTDRQRQVIHQIYFQQRTQREVSRVFGITEPAVSKCISQAKQKMRRNAGRLIGVLQKGE